MIKVFRRIRQNMVKENRTSKYLLYAIGEIILVVIGILIAISISNWNENRKTKLQEANILTQLKVDLEANLIEISDIRNSTNNQKTASETILRYLKEKTPIDDSFKNSIEEIDIDGIFNSANTTYKYIENQGINVLSNDSLRSKITLMYERDFVNIRKRVDIYWQIVTDDLRPFLDLHFTTSSSQLNISNEETDVNLPLNYNELANNTQFKNIVTRLLNFQTLRFNWLNVTIKDLESLIDEVQQEIDRLET